MLNSGAFYLFGRDKFYRPTFVLDLLEMTNLIEIDTTVGNIKVFIDLFTFYWEYVTRVMFLPGQIVQWNIIIDFRNLALDQ